MLLWCLAVPLGFFFVTSVAGIPLSLWLAPTLGAAILIALVNVGLSLFLGYALRGVVRSLRGDPEAPLIPPGLVRPMAFGLGAVAILLGLAGAVGALRSADGHQQGRLIGGGLVFVAYGLFAKRRRSGERDAGAEDTHEQAPKG